MTIEKIYNELGGYDLCEIDPTTNKVIRVLDSSHNGLDQDFKPSRYADELPEPEYYGIREPEYGDVDY